MDHQEELPSEKELDRFAHWGFITVGAMAVASGVPVGLSTFFPGLPVAALVATFGVLMIPVVVCFGILVRIMVRSVKLRKAEQNEGQIIYSNAVAECWINTHTR